MEQTIFQVVRGIRGNAWNSKEGAAVSRVFPIKSVNVISFAVLLDRWGERQGGGWTGPKKKKSENEAEERCTNQSLPDVGVIDRSSVSIRP